MKKVAFIYDEIFLTHEMPQFHPESKNRLLAIVEKLKKSDLWASLIHLKPEKALLSDIEMVHAREYITKVQHFGEGYLDPDTYMSRNTFTATLYGVGAVKTAVDTCQSGEIVRAFCAVRPPGHHAERSRAMGFCIFNNVAVGARYAQKKGYSKVLVVDFDVHHGNGTEHIFNNDNTVFYFSTHQYPYYPGTGNVKDAGEGQGKGYTHNIPLKYGAGDAEVSEAYNIKLHEIAHNFGPDLIIVSAGYDLHQLDPLAGLSVTDDGIRDIVRGILGAKVNIPAIFVLEGGYHLDALSDSIQITIRELLQ